MVPTDLTFAAEALGSVAPVHRREAVDALIAVIEHSKAYVREGAVLGLAGLLPCVRAEALLRRVADQDPSPAVRDTAADALSHADAAEHGSQNAAQQRER